MKRARGWVIGSDDAGGDSCEDKDASADDTKSPAKVDLGDHPAHQGGQDTCADSSAGHGDTDDQTPFLVKIASQDIQGGEVLKRASKAKHEALFRQDKTDQTRQARHKTIDR